MDEIYLNELKWSSESKTNKKYAVMYRLGRKKILH